MRRTAVVNQIRGLLLERGTTLRKGRRYVDEALPGILTGGSSKLSGAVLVLLAELKQELEQLAEKIDSADNSIERIVRENEACRRLVKMPGVGPVTATAIIATIGNGAAFRQRRDFAAWLAQLMARTHQNIAIVALANKLARWLGRCWPRMKPTDHRC
jgi:transposase